MKSAIDHDERGILHAWAHARGARVAQRAQIVLMGVEGNAEDDIARALGCSEKIVARWLSRFAAGGIPALLDAPRLGRPLDEAQHARIRRYLERGTSSRKIAGVTEFARAEEISAHMVWRAARRSARTIERDRRLQIPVELDAVLASSGLGGLFLDASIVVAAFGRARMVTRPVKRGLWDQPPLHITTHYRSRRISPSRPVGLVNCLGAATNVDGTPAQPVFPLAWARWSGRVRASSQGRGAIAFVVSGQLASTSFLKCLVDLRDAMADAPSATGRNSRRNELAVLASEERWRRMLLSRIPGEEGARLGKAIAPWLGGSGTVPLFSWAA